MAVARVAMVKRRQAMLTGVGLASIDIAGFLVGPEFLSLIASAITAFLSSISGAFIGGFFNS